MKLKRWLVVIMSALMVMYSVPVNATNSEDKEETKEMLQTEELKEMQESVLEISSVYETEQETETGSDEEESSTLAVLNVSAETEADGEIEEAEDGEPETQEEAGDGAETVRAADDIASGTYEDITWVIDKDGKLTVTGTGEFAELGGKWERAPWYDYKDTILTAKISIKNITNLRCMFLDCKNLASIDLRELDTRNATNMRSMFSGCSSLESLDVSGFDTANVTDMSEMFMECSKLVSIDVSDFDTANVTDMRNMFWICSSLESLDVSGFDTRNVTYMSYMFGDCSSLESLDVSGFDTRNVTDMWQMFGGCSSLTGLNVRDFNTGNVTNMESMFMDCSSLISLDVSGFDTGNVTHMRDMFSGCSSLESLDVSGFDTGNVMYMRDMFSGCCSLTSLDMSSFDLGNINDSENTWLIMLEDCRNLIQIIAPKKVVCEVPLPTSTGYSWYYNDTEITSLPKNLTSSVTLTKRETPTSSDNIASGTYENITWVIDKNGKLTVTGTGEYATLSPETEDDYWTRAPWYDKRESILSAEINLTGIYDTSCMFRNCSNLKSIDVKNFDTSQVASMEHMFYGCVSLENLDTGGFRTQNVILMDGMFEGCASLKNIDVSSFDTRNVTWMAYMFKDCGSLQKIDVSGFNTSQVGKFNSMFYGCSNLQSIDVSGFNTQNAIDMNRMFHGCKSLQSLDLSNFDTGKVTLMQQMFRGCSNLKNIKFGDKFDTSKVKDMLAMFRECSSLESLNLSGFRTDNVTCIAHMFENCDQLKTVNVSNFNTDKVTEINSMFRECGSLVSLDLSSFNLSNVAEASGIFTSCTSLNTIQTPKNVAVKIALPASSGYSWYNNDTEITILPQNLSTSVKITKDITKSPNEPVKLEIITNKIENAVQNVPYETILQNNGWDAASYHISSGALPEGIELGADGVIYGITKKTGKFQFTVTMTVNGVETSAEKTFILEVLKSTDRNVDAIDEPGYEIIQPIQDINIDKEVTDQLFISNGPFEQFRNAYIDGNKLAKDVDYTAESGSTRITIKSETLDRLEKGKHTLGVEFRTEEGSMKRVAQNFDAKSGKSSNKGDSGNNGSSSEVVSTSSDGTRVILTPSSVSETVLDDTIYYSVYLPSDAAILKLSFFNKVYGNNATVLAYLDNGVGYSMNMNAFLAAGKDLNLSTKEIEMEDFAQGFKTILLSVAKKTDLSYDLGVNLTAGTEYANYSTHVFIYNDVTKTFDPYMETIVAVNGNVGFHTRRLTDFVVMIAEEQ